MGKCVVPGCHVHSDRKGRYGDERSAGVRFYPIPKVREKGPPGTRRRSEVRRRAWLLLINNDDLKDENEPTNRRICGRHFASGKPANPNDERNPDWLPLLHMDFDEPEPAPAPATPQQSVPDPQPQPTLMPVTVKSESGVLVFTIKQIKEEPPEEELEEEFPQPGIGMGMAEEVSPTSDMVTVRCDDFKSMEAELAALRQENADLKKSYIRLRNQLTEADVDKLELNAELAAAKETIAQHDTKYNQLIVSHDEEVAFLKGKLADCEDCIRELQDEEKRNSHVIYRLNTNMEKMKNPIREEQLQDADFINFYTGLPNYTAFLNILDHIGLRVSASELRSILAPWQCLLLTLMRLRLALTLQDLSYRFGVASSTACQTFEKWLFLAYTTLESFIVWPERAERTTPADFKDAFGDNVAVILHCLEVQPESSKSEAKSETAKPRKCVRYMVGITPAGGICFVSRGWDAKGGEVDALVEAGFYECLSPGDEFLADHDLSAGGSAGWVRAEVVQADEGSGEVKLSSRDITDARKLALIRSHIEKITSMKRRYRILRGELPIQGLQKKGKDRYVTQIEQMVNVCCALSNIAENHL